MTKLAVGREPQEADYARYLLPTMKGSVVDILEKQAVTDLHAQINIFNDDVYRTDQLHSDVD